MDLPLQGQEVVSYDERRDIVIPGDYEKTIQFCAEQFLLLGNKAIATYNIFTVALSGGSTPKAIFEYLAKPENRKRLDWEKVLLFWSDERSVPPTHTDSNYRMAMESGLEGLPIPKNHLFRMEAEHDIDAHAHSYEQLIKEKVPTQSFDLMMLGMGEDGHTASLFPKTHGLNATDRLAVANYIPEKHTWRMTLTFEAINAAKNIHIYVLGKNKASMVKKVFTSPYDPSLLPIQKIGTPSHKALWILDMEAASILLG